MTIFDNVSTEAKIFAFNRVVAKFIDFILIIGLSEVFPFPVGVLFAFAYSLLADGFEFWEFKGQSVGKKFFGLQVRNTLEKRQGNYKDSMIRNSPVAVVTFFMLIPAWGWLIALLIGIPLLVLEVYLMLTVEEGHRLGDVMADTEVISTRAVKIEENAPAQA